MSEILKYKSVIERHNRKSKICKITIEWNDEASKKVLLSVFRDWIKDEFDKEE
jgi:hypothetical protein